MNAITYFGEERILNLICIIVGSLSLIFSLIFSGIIKYSFFKGMAVPLFVFGSLQLTTGVIVYNRTNREIVKVEQTTQQQYEKKRADELSKMQTLLEKFRTYKWIEIALMACGLFLYLKFYRSPSNFWKGLGLGLLLQAGISLSLDIIAEQRAEEYVLFLTGK